MIYDQPMWIFYEERSNIKTLKFQKFGNCVKNNYHCKYSPLIYNHCPDCWYHIDWPYSLGPPLTMAGIVNLLSVIVLICSILTTCTSEEGFVISFTENDIVSTEQWAIFTGNTKTNLCRAKHQALIILYRKYPTHVEPDCLPLGEAEVLQPQVLQPLVLLLQKILNRWQIQHLMPEVLVQNWQWGGRARYKGCHRV